MFSFSEVPFNSFKSETLRFMPVHIGWRVFICFMPWLSFMVIHFLTWFMIFFNLVGSSSAETIFPEVLIALNVGGKMSILGLSDELSLRGFKSMVKISFYLVRCGWVSITGKINSDHIYIWHNPQVVCTLHKQLFPLSPKPSTNNNFISVLLELVRKSFSISFHAWNSFAYSYSPSHGSICISLV